MIDKQKQIKEIVDILTQPKTVFYQLNRIVGLKLPRQVALQYAEEMIKAGYMNRGIYGYSIEEMNEAIINLENDNAKLKEDNERLNLILLKQSMTLGLEKMTATEIAREAEEKWCIYKDRDFWKNKAEALRQQIELLERHSYDQEENSKENQNEEKL